MINIKKTGLVCGMLAALPLYAGTMGPVATEYSWFGSIGAGYSWTTLPGIDNPNPSEWDNSILGYNGGIGNRGFFTLAFGKQVHEFIDVSAMYMMHEEFNYQRYQFGNSDTPDFTGSQRNRFFNLNNKSVLFNATLHPAHAWKRFANIDWTPYVGAGIGYAYNYVNNFYTVGTESISGSSLGSTDSVGTPVGTSSFAWQGTAAINMRFQDSHFSINTGYRYYDGGKFYGPSIIYTNSGGLGAATPWSGKVQANQYFLELNYSV